MNHIEIKINLLKKNSSTEYKIEYLSVYLKKKQREEEEKKQYWFVECKADNNIYFALKCNSDDSIDNDNVVDEDNNFK